MNYTSIKCKLALAAATAVLALGSASLAQAETPSWCGPKQATLALLDGYGGNSWRQVTAASGAQTASLCPSITKYEYVDGQGDTQKSISDIKATAAKGTDALVVFGDAGPAVLPAITQVYKSGKIIVPYRVVVGGKEGENYNTFVGTDLRGQRRGLGQLDQGRNSRAARTCSISAAPPATARASSSLRASRRCLGRNTSSLTPSPSR